MISPLKTSSSNLEAKHLLRGACILILLSIGCTDSSQEHDHIVYHHRPAGFEEAVTRLDEIHTAMIGKAPLPSPRQFEDTGHHHHHDDDSENHEHSHEHEHERIEVNIFQECYDVVRWLPTIAGETDLPKKHWDEVNQLSKDLSKLVVDIQSVGNTKDQEALRKKHVENEKEISRIIQSLKDMIPVHDEWKKKILKWRPFPESRDHRMSGDAKGELQHA